MGTLNKKTEPNRRGEKQMKKKNKKKNKTKQDVDM
jgi:hypothetical protein